jgi:hypothetical protein
MAERSRKDVWLQAWPRPAGPDCHRGHGGFCPFREPQHRASFGQHHRTAIRAPKHPARIAQIAGAARLAPFKKGPLNAEQGSPMLHGGNHGRPIAQILALP